MSREAPLIIVNGKSAEDLHCLNEIKEIATDFPFEKIDDIINELEKIVKNSTVRVHDAFRYTAIFMNLIDKSSKKDYDLSELTKIVIELYEKDHQITKKGFKIWMLGNCLTNILEALNHFLEKLIVILGIIKDKKTSLEGSIPHYLIEKERIEAVASIRKARNCIIHNFGIVRKSDLTQNNEFFKLKWFYIKDYPNFVSEFGDYYKTFRIGDSISLTPQELFRIGIFIEDVMVQVLGKLRYWKLLLEASS